MIDDRIVYFDMDGVLVNFRKGANRIGITFKGYSIINPEESWDRINKIGVDFWKNLDWVEGSKELFKYACQHFSNVQVLSARSKDKSSVIGKLVWCKRLEKIASEYNTKFKVNIVWKSQKKNFSTLNGNKNILIDDLKENLLNWEGESILFKNPKQAKNELIELEREKYVKREYKSN